ncbi:cysteinyl-tRNA synthetase [Maize bushy stunt phytoplasma]|uniref:Cysteine--tRNA ligase n=1 Tax=Maize bushy stunt phytoplasma TaxID=202462 RepID=A0ABN4RZ34_9MOLU|nr:cysteine--tRNA ligase [Maize bushy stunt phytoplasma]AOF54951.1 cysteinyl-tRNA synthetase [Maize bushy stunt phytoplasma]
MLKIYNSLTRKKEFFNPAHPPQINMYVCGPTVYNHLHLGNTRPLIFFDTVKRYLEMLNFRVYYVVNITDIDDKIIENALKNQVLEQDLANKYIKSFNNLLKTLNIQTINFKPQATQYINSMIVYIQTLLDQGFAYFTDQGIYFRVSKIDDYGKLKKQDLSQLKQNARKQLDPQKEFPGDFILWKKTSQGITYPSPWFAGRPGWHTECATMIEQLFKLPLDIHGGGTDLKFPHHENEIAQTHSHSHQKLANFFMHVERLDYQNQKMSKSLGNIIWCKDLLKQYNPCIIKLLILSTHYRKPINFSYDLMEQAQQKYQKITDFLTKNNFYLKVNQFSCQTLDQDIMQLFHQLMQDDLATHKVIDLMEQTIKQTHQTQILDKLSQFQNSLLLILNILGIAIPFNKPTKIDLQTYFLWQDARKCRDFAQADILRKQLLDKGFI